MSSIVVILIVVALNLIPANVTKFTMQMNGEETIHFTKQADGGWNAVELPSTFSVNGAKLTTKVQGKEHTQDLANMLGVDKDTDWKKLNEIKFGDTPVQIERNENGLDFILKEKKGDSETAQTFKVRWERK